MGDSLQQAALLHQSPWGAESVVAEQVGGRATPSSEPQNVAGNTGFVTSGGLYAKLGKRRFDLVVAAAFMLLLGFWLLPGIALLIRLDSKGPALFRQTRVGKGGRPFQCIKFRTMVHDPNARFAQATKDDLRVTRIGRFLRSSNLDELPQFLNVLKGDMSVVGPRPHVPELDEAFAGRVPGYHLRTALAPGVTGLAQVSGCRGETRSLRNMTHRVRFDLFYSRSFSFGMDVRIILLTILAAWRGDARAY